MAATQHKAISEYQKIKGWLDEKIRTQKKKRISNRAFYCN